MIRKGSIPSCIAASASTKLCHKLTNMFGNIEESIKQLNDDQIYGSEVCTPENVVQRAEEGENARQVDKLNRFTSKPCLYHVSVL